MISSYSSAAEAIIDLHTRGFDHDFYISNKTLLCIESDLRFDPYEDGAVEIHEISTSNRKKWVVAMDLTSFHIKGLMMIRTMSALHQFKSVLNMNLVHQD